MKPKIGSLQRRRILCWIKKLNEVFLEKYYINGKKATEFQLTVVKAIEWNSVAFLPLM